MAAVPIAAAAAVVAMARHQEEEESQPEPAVSEGVPPEVRVLLLPRLLVAGC